MKAKLIKGEADEILISQPDGIALQVVVKAPTTPFQRFLKKVKDKPIKVIRPDRDLF
mgnify:CR=1 FL=1